MNYPLTLTLTLSRDGRGNGVTSLHAAGNHPD